MARPLTAGWLLAILAAAAVADQLYLTDGRTFIGNVTVEQDSVQIEMPMGSMRLPKDQVLRIEWRETPEEQLAKKLTETNAKDPGALFEVARWALDQNLKAQGRHLCQQVLQLDGEHAGARQELGQMKVAGRWTGYDEAMQLAQSWLEAGRYAELLKDLLPGLDRIAPTPEAALAVGELQGQAQTRAGQFDAAAKTFAALAARARPPASVRYQATADVLAANRDGMYILSEPYPPMAGLLQQDRPVLPPGPASLAGPQVLAASLRDLAKKGIEAGRQLMEAARQVEPSDPSGALAKYGAALKAFDQADALCERISFSYRVEIARRKIALMRKDADEAARRFDAAMNALGQQELTAPAYRETVTQLIRHLDKVQENLTAILAVAKPFDRELVLEIKWAETDLARIRRMRQELAGELDDNP